MRALVLGGGGSRGAYQAGHLRRLTESGRSWDVVYGTSVGAINACGIAQYPQVAARDAAAAVEARWLSLRGTGDVLGPRPGGVLEALAQGSLWTTTPLRARLTDWMTRALVLPVHVGVTEMAFGTHALVQLRALDLETRVTWVMASSSYPLAMPAVRVGHSLYRDGGVRAATCLLEALAQPYEEIDVVLCSNPDDPGEHVQQFKAPMHDLMRCVEILAANGRGSLDAAHRAWSTLHIRPIVRVWWPSSTPTRDPMAFDAREIETAIRRGYDDKQPQEIW